MLSFDRESAAILQDTSTIKLGQKELTQITQSINILTSQCAFLAGIGSGGLSHDRSWDVSLHNSIPELAFYTLASLSFGLNVATIAIARQNLISAPVLAISGPRDGPARAVEALQEERGVLMRLYWLGLFSALMSRVFLTYLIFTASIQVMITSTLVTTLMIISLWVVFCTRPKFLVPPEYAKLKNEERRASIKHNAGYVGYMRLENAEGEE